MIKHFNIKYRPQIEAGEYKVRTAYGQPARIVCWDARTPFDQPIVALIEYKSDGCVIDMPVCYTEDGVSLYSPGDDFSSFGPEGAFLAGYFAAAASTSP